MALSEEDKKEMLSTMARGFADGLKLFRSETEEEAAKNAPKEEPENKPAKKPLDFWAYLLGAK